MFAGGRGCGPSTSPSFHVLDGNTGKSTGRRRGLHSADSYRVTHMLGKNLTLPLICDVLPSCLRNGPAAARTRRTKSTGGFYQADVAPCSLEERGSVSLDGYSSKRAKDCQLQLCYQNTSSQRVNDREEGRSRVGHESGDRNPISAAVLKTSFKLGEKAEGAKHLEIEA